jgi:uncharacterized membrane protein YhfC
MAGDQSRYLIFLFSPAAIVLVAVGGVLYWRRRSRAGWRWFWAGAAVWAVGVALKFAWALLLNEPILAAFRSTLPRSLYLGTGSLYIGVLTGVFEIGVTLAAALIWRRMARAPGRAVAVGLGAGAFEALLVAVAALVAVVVAVSGKVPGAANQFARATALTPVVWLVGPVERVLAILCHTSSRALVLLAVARRRWRYFWWGFLLMTGLDSVAGFAHLAGFIGTVNMWWVELAIAPFAIASIPIIGWCIRSWPEPEAGENQAPPPM